MRLTLALALSLLSWWIGISCEDCWITNEDRADLDAFLLHLDESPEVEVTYEIVAGSHRENY